MCRFDRRLQCKTINEHWNAHLQYFTAIDHPGHRKITENFEPKQFGEIDWIEKEEEEEEEEKRQHTRIEIQTRI